MQRNHGVTTTLGPRDWQAVLQDEGNKAFRIFHRKTLDASVHPRVFYHKVKYTSMSADHLSATFAALADPTRRAILARLAAGESSVTEIARPFAISLPAITKHLKVLERSGLITRSRDAQWRPCRLEAGPMKEAVDWLQHYRRHWEESFDRLDEYLKLLQSKENKHDHPK